MSYSLISLSLDHLPNKLPSHKSFSQVLLSKEPRLKRGAVRTQTKTTWLHCLCFNKSVLPLYKVAEQDAVHCGILNVKSNEQVYTQQQGDFNFLELNKTMEKQGKWYVAKSKSIKYIHTYAHTNNTIHSFKDIKQTNQNGFLRQEMKKRRSRRKEIKSIIWGILIKNKIILLP